MQVPIAFDSVSPQTALVAAGCDWLRGELDRPTGDPPAERVAALVIALADAQPAMAAFVALGTRLLAVADKAALEEAPEVEARARVRAALEAWQRDFAAAGEQVAQQAQAALPGAGWVATTTRSSLVERALVLAHEAGRKVHVLLAESRPANEGQGLARALAGRGIPVWYAVDGTLPLLLPQAGAFLLGADAVREKTFVGKAGTWALLLAARELNLPAWVLAQRAKFVPARCTRLALPRRPAEEVWADAPRGVSVVNAPFEEIPLALVRGVITEAGFLGPREVEDAAAMTATAPALREASGPRQAG